MPKFQILRNLAVLSLLLSSVPTYSANYALLVGGSGEEPGKDNFFEADFSQMENSLKGRNWKVSSAFDDNTHLLNDSVTATGDHIQSKTETLVAQAKSGDEVLIFVHSHGARKKDFQTSHSIESEDQDGFSLDRMKPSIDKLKAKGVKVALVDLSCFSGNTQNLEKGICTVTLASSQYVSICSGDSSADSFTSKFVNFPSSGKLNLEDQFLGARRQDVSSTNLPEISSVTLPGKDFWDVFLKDTDPNSMARRRFYLGGTQPEECEACKNGDNLNKSLGNFKNIVNSLKDPKLTDEFNRAISDYLKQFKIVDDETKNINETFSKIPGWGFSDLPITNLDEIPIGQMEEYVKILASGTNPASIAWLSPEERRALQYLRPYTREIVSRYNSVVGGSGINWAQYNKDKTALRDSGARVMKLERQAYDEYQKLHPTRKNALCQNFTL